MRSTPSSSVTRALSQRLRGEFPANDRQRGREYWFERRVSVERADHSGILATVRGTQPYRVSLQWRGGQHTVDGFCDCPRWDEAGVCKHLWALVLEADARHLERAIDARGRLFLTADNDLPYDGGDLDADDEADGGFGTPVGLERGHQPARSRPLHAPPPWRRDLADLEAAFRRARVVPATVAPSEVWFAVDVASTRQQGVLEVLFFHRRLRRDGAWSAVKPLAISVPTLQAMPPGENRALLELCYELAMRDDGYSYSYSYGSYGAPRRRSASIPPPLHGHVLSRLAATGRLCLRHPGAALPELAPLSWDDGQPWSFRLRVERRPKRDLLVTGELVRGEVTRSLADPVVLLASGLVVFSDTVALLESGELFPWISLLRARGSLGIAAAEETDAVEALLGMPALPPIVGDGFALQLETEQPRPRLSLLRRHRHETRAPAALELVYDGIAIAPEDDRMVVCHGSRLLRRDLAAERVALAFLAALPGVHDERACAAIDTPLGSSRGRFAVEERHLGAAVDRLLAAGWEVLAEGGMVRRAGGVRVRVRSSVDWLDLEVETEFEGERPQAGELLAALARRTRFVRLGDGTFGLLPEEWLARWSPLARLAAGAATGGSGLRFLPAQALLLDALLSDAPQVDLDAAFTRWRERLLHAQALGPAAAGPGFHGRLREYQQRGLAWLRWLDEIGLGGCLADDMGLGKTVQVLAHLVDRHAGGAARPPSLVVAPRSVVYNWIEEAARFAPALRVLDYSRLHRAALREQIAAHDLVVTTYGVVRREAAELRARRFDYLVLDEAQVVKNADTQSYKACRLLAAERRLALSGTPVENHLGELWSLLELLNPGLIGRLSEERTASRGPELSDKELAAVSRAVRPFLLRRTKQEVLAELPAKTEQTLFCTLGDGQRRLYDQLKAHYQQALRERIGVVGIGRTRIQILEALLRLRQAACHPGLLGEEPREDRVAKLETLLAQLAEVRAEGSKALVFSQFTRFLALVRPELDRAGIRYEYLDGRTRDRAAKVQRFAADPHCTVFLVSLKAGGLGINLTAASYVFLLDPWWNPAVEAQAIDRAHRIGQQRPVFAYRLIARDTVEERILELQHRKRRVADAILAADSGALAQLTVEDLELLLR